MEFGTPAFWLALLQIIGVNIALANLLGAAVASEVMARADVPVKVVKWGMQRFVRS
jgi:hypothetical protein